MNRKIIITGGLGFIGSNYLNKLVLAYPDYDFINVDSVTYAANPENILPEVNSASNYHFIKADIRDLEAMRQIFEAHRPTDIVHPAEESHVDMSIPNPAIFMETNITGT